jgi:hypothetical protein
MTPALPMFWAALSRWDYSLSSSWSQAANVILAIVASGAFGFGRDHCT